MVTTYYIATPIYFVLGTIGRSLCLAFFYKQYKQETAYMYQIFASVTDMLEILAVSLNMITFNCLSGYRFRPGVTWYKQSYPCMFWAAHLTSPLEQSFLTFSLLLSVSMAADRVFALSKPFKYRNSNRMRHQLTALTTCFLLSFTISIFDMFRFETFQDGDHYIIKVNQDYVTSNLALGMTMVRNCVRIIGDILLISCNVAVIVLYRSSVKTAAIAIAGNEQKEAQHKAMQRSLVLLTVCESFFNTIVITSWNIYYTLVYLDPTFSLCLGKLVGPICDLLLEVAGVLEFFALLLVSKQFRDAVFNQLKCMKEQVGTSAVHPIGTGSTGVVRPRATTSK